MRLLVQEALRRERMLLIPSAVLAQVWRDGTRQARVAALVKDPRTTVRALAEDDAKAIGVLCGRSGVADIVDGQVALLARQLDGVIVTSDPGDIARFGADLLVEQV